MSFPFCQCFFLVWTRNTPLEYKRQSEATPPQCCSALHGKALCKWQQRASKYPKAIQREIPYQGKLLRIFGLWGYYQHSCCKSLYNYSARRSQPTLRDNSFRKSIPATEGECNPWQSTASGELRRAIGQGTHFCIRSFHDTNRSHYSQACHPWATQQSYPNPQQRSPPRGTTMGCWPCPRDRSQCSRQDYCDQRCWCCTLWLWCLRRSDCHRP